MESMKAVDVAIIGAGPAGAVAAAYTRQRGLSVRMIEKARFPRFQIGESLLPQCMEMLAEAGLVDAVDKAGFQRKNGAQIVRGNRRRNIVFSDKSTPGYDYTYDVTRADFDLLLARGAEKQGAELYFGHETLDVEFPEGEVRLRTRDEHGVEYEHQARFVLDASGFAAVLPRLLGLRKPSDFPPRAAVFTHIRHHIDDPAFDPHKVRIGIHPEHGEVSSWLIPFPDGVASVGVVAADKFLKLEESDPDTCLWRMINEESELGRMLGNAEFLWPARVIKGYASDVTQTYGDRYALVGSAAGFLDPVFSSGVTLGMASAKYAVDAMARELAGETVDWEQDFAQPMALGVGTCRDVVETWYEGDLQEILLNDKSPDRIYSMLCGVLGGYVWDRNNPYVGNPARRFRTLAQVIRNERKREMDDAAATPG